MFRYFTLVSCALVVFIDGNPLDEQRLFGNVNPSFSSNVKVYSGQATYYDPGLGACGIRSSGSEFVSAIPDALYDTQTINGNPNNNKFCGKQMSVTGPIGTVIVTIVDRCGSCKGGDLDLSRPAFNQIGSTINGRVPITWRFI